MLQKSTVIPNVVFATLFVALLNACGGTGQNSTPVDENRASSSTDAHYVLKSTTDTISTKYVCDYEIEPGQGCDLQFKLRASYDGPTASDPTTIRLIAKADRFGKTADPVSLNVPVPTAGEGEDVQEQVFRGRIALNEQVDLSVRFADDAVLPDGAKINATVLTAEIPWGFCTELMPCQSEGQRCNLQGRCQTREFYVGVYQATLANDVAQGNSFFASMQLKGADEPLGTTTNKEAGDDLVVNWAHTIETLTYDQLIGQDQQENEVTIEVSKADDESVGSCSAEFTRADIAIPGRDELTQKRFTIDQCGDKITNLQWFINER